MNSRKPARIAVTCALFVGLAGSALAGPPDGKGPGGKDKDSSPGGNGFNTPSPISLTITFDDHMDDAIRSDGDSYIDEANDLPNALAVHIDGDSGGSYGNLFLHTGNTDPAYPRTRTVSLDIYTGCEDGCENQPFTRRKFHFLGLTVSATESIVGGLCGMLVDESITAPMQLIYADADPDAFGTEAPGFIDFFPASKRKSPCFGQTSDVTVKREGDHEWIVSGNVAACITWPGGREFGGVSLMPFEFTAQNNQIAGQPVCK
jgi:hypothetical protein